MNLKLISVPALCLVAGVAFAQESGSNTGSTSDTTATDQQMMMNDKEKMKAFYSDADMKTLRPSEEFKAAFMAMSADDQAKLRQECQNSTSQKDEFCVSLKSIATQ